MCRNSPDGGEGSGKDRSHFPALQVPSRQHEHSYLGTRNCSEGGSSLSDLLVFRENDPVVFTSRRQPYLIWGVGSEVGIVNLYVGASLSKRVGDDVFTKGSVDKENREIRLLRVRARSGSPLRFGAGPVHSP